MLGDGTDSFQTAEGSTWNKIQDWGSLVMELIICISHTSSWKILCVQGFEQHCRQIQKIYLFTYLPHQETSSQKNEEVWLWVPEDNNELSSWGPVWGQSRTGPWLDPVQNLSQWLMIQPSPAWLRFVYRPHDRAIHSDNHNLTLWDQILVQDLWVPKTTWLCSGGDGAGVGSFSLQSLGSLPSFGLRDRPRGQEQGQQTKQQHSSCFLSPLDFFHSVRG